MADYSLAEIQMMAKYWGKPDLIDDEIFWIECIMVYQDKIVPLPLQDNAETRRRLIELLMCPAGKCGACCRYPRVPLTPIDINRLNEHKIEYIMAEQDGQRFLDCSKGCQFLEDSRCKIYQFRPTSCFDYPIMQSREAVLDNKPVQQAQYRIKCRASLDVIRTIFKESINSSPSILLPDLTIVPVVRTFEIPKCIEQSLE